MKRLFGKKVRRCIIRIVPDSARIGSIRGEEKHAEEAADYCAGRNTQDMIPGFNFRAK